MVDVLQVQGITSLTIGEEGNPLYAKNWRPYAIFRSVNISGEIILNHNPGLSTGVCSM